MTKSLNRCLSFFNRTAAYRVIDYTADLVIQQIIGTDVVDLVK